MLLGFANWDTLPTEAAVKAEAKQEASWRQSGLSLNKTKEKENASPQHDTKFVFNLQKSLPGLVGHRSWCAMGWGEGEVRPRSCKLLNCSNLPVMASAQSGGWTHAMHSSTFGSELGGREGGTGAFTFPHCSRGLQLWCVGYYNASCLPRPILGQLLKEMGHFSWLTRPPRIRGHPGLLTRHRKIVNCKICKLTKRESDGLRIWETTIANLQLSTHIFSVKRETGFFK